MSEALIEKATAIVQQKITDAKEATPGPYVAGADGLYWVTTDGGRFIATLADQSNGSQAMADAQNFANHSPDVMVPLWEWMLETLGKWREWDSPSFNAPPGRHRTAAQNNARSTLAESLARAICGATNE